MTTEMELNDSFDSLARTAFRVKQDRDELLEALKGCRDSLVTVLEMSPLKNPNALRRIVERMEVAICHAESGDSFPTLTRNTPEEHI